MGGHCVLYSKILIKKPNASQTQGLSPEGTGLVCSVLQTKAIYSCKTPEDSYGPFPHKNVHSQSSMVTHTWWDLRKDMHVRAWHTMGFAPPLYRANVVF